MEIRAAKQTELEEVIDLAAAVFVERCRPRYASQHLEDSTYALHQSRVCVVDGRVVSQVRVSEREMRIGSAVVKLGGVGLVGHAGEVQAQWLLLGCAERSGRIHGSRRL